MPLDANIAAGFEAVAQAIKPLIPPPLDTFVPGWVPSGYPAVQLQDVLETSGTIHCAVSFGPQTPTIGNTTFEAHATVTGDTTFPNVDPAYSGTNWELVRASFTSTPPTIGSNSGRSEVTAFADFPDPSFGTVPGMQTLCIGSARRNQGIRFNNLVVGNRYYGVFCFFAYPDSLTRATILTPDDGDGSSDTFGVDGTGWIASNGVRRYGWEATSTSIEFIKASYDTNGSYITAFACVDLGASPSDPGGPGA